jgi:RHS repeat-associated protein
MEIQERVWKRDVGYRFGFNGIEKDDEIKGSGNSLDFGARIYDSRLGRWLSVDPKQSKYPYESPYCFAGNSPVIMIDIGGESKYSVIHYVDEQGNTIRTVYILVDDEILEIVEVDVPSTISNGDWTREYDYYDIYEVTTIKVMDDGTQEVVGDVKTIKGEKRAHTWYRSQWAANLIKEENEFEEKFEKGLTGIRWTSSSPYAQGNSHDDKNKSYIRSEDLDMLLAVLGAAKGSRDGTAKPLVKPIKDVKSFLEKLGASKDAVDASKTLKDIYDKQQKPSNNKPGGYICPSCKDTVGPDGHNNIKPIPIKK